MANNNKNYAEFQPWVNLSFYWLKASFCFKRLLLAGRQSSIAAIWLVDREGSYPFAQHKDVPQRSADRWRLYDVSLLNTPAFCTWKCHSRGSDGLEKRCLTLSLCSTSVSLISFCVFLCVPQTTTRHCQRQNTTEKSITCLTSRPITCWPENAPVKNKKDKKTCLLVSFQPQWNVTDEYFFSHTLFRKHIWYVAGCVSGFLPACTYIDENGSDHILGLLFFLAFLFLVPEITFHDVCGRVMPLSESCKTPNIHHPSLCLCCSEIH